MTLQTRISALAEGLATDNLSLKDTIAVLRKDAGADIPNLIGGYTFDDAPEGAMRCSTSEVLAKGGPSPYGCVFYTHRFSSINAAQISFEVAGPGETYTRHRLGAGWQPWRKIITSGNFSDYAGGELGALGSVPLPAYYDDVRTIEEFRAIHGSTGEVHLTLGGDPYTIDLSQTQETPLTTAGGVKITPRTTNGRIRDTAFGLQQSGDQQAALAALIAWTTGNNVGVHWTAGAVYDFSGELHATGYVDWVCDGKFELHSTKTAVSSPTEYQGDVTLQIDSPDVAAADLVSNFQTGDAHANVDSSAGMQVGDIIHVRSTRLIDTDHRGAWQEGQVMKIAGIEGNQLLLSDPFDYSGRASDVVTGTLTSVAGDKYSVTVSDTFAGNGRDLRVKLTITDGADAGEFRMIVAASNSNLTLRHSDEWGREPWPAGVQAGDAYAFEWSSAITVYRPAKCSIQGLKLTRDRVTDAVAGDNSYRGLRLAYLDAPVIKDCEFYNFPTTNVHLSLCYRPIVRDVVTAGANRSYDAYNGTGYGISVEVCAYPLIEDVQGYANRRTVDFSGSSGYTNHGVCRRVTNAGGGKAYSGDWFFPRGASRQQVAGSHGSGRFSVYEDCVGVDVYGGINLRGRSEMVIDYRGWGYANDCVSINYGSGHTVDGLIYEDKFTEATRAKDFRQTIASKYDKRPLQLITMSGSDDFSDNVYTTFKNITANSVVRCVFYAAISGADVLRNLRLENIHVTCTPEGTSETAFTFLHCPNSPTFADVYMQNCGFKALAGYSSGAVMLRTYGTGDSDGGSFTAAAGSTAQINGVWYIDVPQDGVVRIPYDGSMAHVSIHNNRVGNRPSGHGVLLEADTATDRAGVSNRNKIDLLAAYPTDASAVTAGNIGIHLSKSKGVVSIANNVGGAQSMKVGVH